MTRPHFLRAPNALPRRTWFWRRLVSEAALWVFLAIALAWMVYLLVPAVLDAAAYEVRRLRTTEVAHDCRMPTEHEQLHVIITTRDGRVGVSSCLYVGSRGTYRRTPSGLPEARP